MVTLLRYKGNVYETVTVLPETTFMCLFDLAYRNCVLKDQDIDFVYHTRRYMINRAISLQSSALLLIHIKLSKEHSYMTLYSDLLIFN